uniref:Ribonucleoside-diphosphate reductase n=1 Tax=Ectropis obliqua nucleopolyhedrovirus TaxID=59376 RepID=S5U7U2_9ABAC|nr:ribonucleotide reductase alpha subunit [Ectropis obliqua nucleopolyhedrovirus]QWV59714.1 ribonucleotide reductase large subunit [Ectropis obliqua nucleopolyhedrovirus]UYO72922.1 ribonucleotide reductase large subunit [Ectropis obliqua nucleopolyhedrovirus]
MFSVTKRDNAKQCFDQKKIVKTLQNLSVDLNKNLIDCEALVAQLKKTLVSNVSTSQLCVLLARESASMAYIHDDYAMLAGRLMVIDNHKQVSDDYAVVVDNLYNQNLVSAQFYKSAIANMHTINATLNYNLDYDYKYFGFKTLENGYLKTIEGKVAERIQHMYMRVALTIHGNDTDDCIENVFETYNLMAHKMYTHASPTLFASGSCYAQLASCFLLNIKEDSIVGIYETLRDCALISKFGGGIGLSVHNVRARGSFIESTNGTANGLEAMLRVYNNAVRHVDQGGKRKGAMAIYVEPWHADIYDFLELKRNMGAEDRKARDLLYALWVPDLFMKRVEADGMWSLMCPRESPLLDTVHGSEFEQLYVAYEKCGKFVRQIKARDLFRTIVETQVETGTPYMMYKDACNMKSNQKHLGTIKNSNLCAEIVEYSDKNESAVCNLASICVNQFVDIDVGEYNFEMLKYVTKIVVKNLNKIIDINYYPLLSAQKSNRKHRPIGVGIQGLADTFAMLRMPYESDQAKVLNTKIAETIYFGALEASCELAKAYGVHDSYFSSPASLGILQYDLWNHTPTSMWDWTQLKKDIKQHGLRNSLCVAYMPTATTAQILGNNESFEPFTNNIYVRRVLAGDFQVINKYLTDDLIKLNLYNEQMRNKIIANNGSVQNIEEIPKHVRELYKTVWEMKVKNLIGMAADRGPFIDQSQSFNIFLSQPTYALLTTIHMHTWKSGLKTGMYYLRTKPAADAIKFTVDKSQIVCNACSS